MDSSQQHAQRPRSSTHFSFRSDKSNDPHSTKSKHERKVSDSERRKTHYDPGTKANPNAAMNEAQPIAAALEKPTLQSLRSFQHNDAQGNLISDPDLSNPTRSRWERPLDTIKSFEAAIDGEYRRRAQSMRADQTDMMSGYASRRSSYYGGNGGGYDNNSRFSRASYYGGRGNGRDMYENGDGFGGPVGAPPARQRYGNRMQSDSGYNYRNSGVAGHNVYPIHGLQQSRDTVNTNGSSGSHSDGPYSTDPSSDNSSFDRAVPVQRPQPPPQPSGEQYGFNGFGQGPNVNVNQFPPGQNGNGYFPQAQQGGPPPPPKHAASPGPIKLTSNPGSTPAGGRPNVLSKTNSDEKRKSWFKRRFSKD